MIPIILSTFSYYSKRHESDSFSSLLIIIAVVFIILIVIGCWMEKARRDEEEYRREEKLRREIEAENARIAREKRRIEERKLREQREKEEKKERIIEATKHRKFVTEQRKLMTDSIRYDVLRRDDFRCQICGMSAKDGVRLHVDHIYPVSKGGKTEMSNLRTLCERCNMGKRDKIETQIVEESGSKVEIVPYLEMQNVKHEQKLELKNYTHDGVIQLFGEKEIDYIDKTEVKGCLWVYAERGYDDLIFTISVNGKRFNKAEKSKALSGKPGWFVNLNE